MGLDSWMNKVEKFFGRDIDIYLEAMGERKRRNWSGNGSLLKKELSKAKIFFNCKLRKIVGLSTDYR